MKKLSAIGLALGVVCVMCTVVVPSALAVSKLLANGSAITEDLEVSISGSLILKDNNPLVGNVEILCEGIFDGLIEPGTEGVLGFVNAVLMANGELLEESAADLEATRTGGDDIECTPITVCNNPTLVVAINLPWHLEVELAGGVYFFNFLELNEAGLSAGYSISCKTIFGTSTVFCDGLVRAEILEDASGNANTEFNPATSGKTLCSDGTEGTVESAPLETGGPKEEPIVDTKDGALISLSEN